MSSTGHIDVSIPGKGRGIRDGKGPLLMRCQVGSRRATATGNLDAQAKAGALREPTCTCTRIAFPSRWQAEVESSGGTFPLGACPPPRAQSSRFSPALPLLCSRLGPPCPKRWRWRWCLLGGVTCEEIQDVVEEELHRTRASNAADVYLYSYEYLDGWAGFVGGVGTLMRQAAWRRKTWAVSTALQHTNESRWAVDWQQEQRRACDPPPSSIPSPDVTPREGSAPRAAIGRQSHPLAHAVPGAGGAARRSLSGPRRGQEPKRPDERGRGLGSDP